MLVNYIIPVCNLRGSEYEERLENLIFIINEFLMRQDCQVKVIIVEQIVGDYPEFSRGLLRGLSDKSLKHLLIKTVTYKTFNKPWLYNIGMKLAEGDNCFIGESDMFTVNDDLLKGVVEFAKQNRYPWCFAWDEMRYLHKNEKEELIQRANDLIQIPDNLRYYAMRMPAKGCMEGGPIYFRKFFWENVLRGANEMYYQLGAIDNDICYRSSKFSNVYPTYHQVMFHLWHKDSPLKNDQTRKVNTKLWKYTSRGVNYLNIDEILYTYGTGNEDQPSQIPDEIWKDILK